MSNTKIDFFKVAVQYGSQRKRGGAKSLKRDALYHVLEYVGGSPESIANGRIMTRKFMQDLCVAIGGVEYIADKQRKNSRIILR
jgi:hypothetical protein